MTWTTTMLSKFVLITAALFAFACDPCMPTIDSDGLVAVPDGCYQPPGTTSGGQCPDAPSELMCSGPPFPGEMWGRCHPDKTCSDGAMCIIVAGGEVCAPACGECGCMDGQQCLGGTCDEIDGNPSACLPACSNPDDPCPVDGTVCDLAAGFCLWPKP